MSALTNPFEVKSDIKPDANTKVIAGQTRSADDIESFLSREDDVKESPEKDEEETEEITKKSKAKSKEDDDKEDDVKPKEGDNEDEDEEDDEDDDDLELKEDEEEEEKLDLKEDKEDDDKIAIPPRKKEITAKYPNFFKEFPFFEKMMFRDRQYTELFGSFDDAKALAERSEIFNGFEQKLFSGDTATILSVVKDSDPKAFNKIVDNYFESLKSVDKEAYDDVLNNVVKRISAGMAAEARRKNNDQLMQSAKDLYEYIMGTDQWEDVKLRSKADEPNEDKKKLDEERQSFIQEKFNDARNTLQTRIDNILKSTISEYIDPKESMSEYERSKAISDCLNKVHKLVSDDRSFVANLNRLWKAAFDSKFDKTSLDNIMKSYKGKAKTQLAKAIKEIRSEVLKGRMRNRKPSSTKEETPRERKSIPAGRPISNEDKKANTRMKGETIEEFFNR